MPSNSSKCPTRPGILVVDNELLIVRLIATILERVGFTIFPALTGTDAVRLFGELSPPPALAILDVNLRVSDGVRVLRQLRARDPILPCCFLAGCGGKYTVFELLAEGAAHIFLKPFNVRRLSDTVERMVLGPVRSAAWPTPPGMERRRFPRWEVEPFGVTATPLLDAAIPQVAWVCDGSLGGVRLTANTPWPCGTTLFVNRVSTPNAGQLLEVRNVVTSGSGAALGCRFLTPPNMRMFLPESEEASPLAARGGGAGP